MSKTLTPAIIPRHLAQETRARFGLIGAALAVGLAGELALPRSAVFRVGITVLSAVLPIVASLRWRRLAEAFAGFRFAGTYLAVMAGVVVVGTLVQPETIFHSLWFASLLGVLAGALVVSAVRRWPLTWKNLGFFVCHLGLLLVLAGSALSTLFSVRGKLDLRIGAAPATEVAVTRAGKPTGATAPLGFPVKLDGFRVDTYDTQYRMTLYELLPDGGGKQLASFDPTVGEVHRLPDNAMYRVESYRDNNGDPEVTVALAEEEGTRRGVLVAHKQDAVFFGNRKVLTFERRPDEAKAYRSSITADGRKLQVAVNDPAEVSGWTLYQSTFDPKDPSYSGLEAVHDPGIPWVFAGFALVSLGVPYMVNIAPWLRRRQQQKGGQS
jgi:ResB-like family protein